MPDWIARSPLLLVAGAMIVLGGCGMSGQPGESLPLEDALGLMRHVEDRTQAVSAEVATTTDPKLAAQAMARLQRRLGIPDDQTGWTAYPRAISIAPVERETSQRVAFARPDRFRVEQVVDGRRWVSIGDRRRLLSYVEGAGATRADAVGSKLNQGVLSLPVPDQRAFADMFDWEVVGSRLVDDREATTLFGRPRPKQAASGSAEQGDAAPSPYELTGDAGADEVEVDVDNETGVILRADFRLEGRSFSTVQLSDLRLGAPDEEAFSTEVPPDVRLLSDDELAGTTVTPQQAAAAAPFTVFAPPDSWDYEVMTHRWIDGSVRVSINPTRVRSPQTHWMVMLTQATAELAVEETREVTREGITLRISGPLGYFTRGGTLVSISARDESQMFRVASALQPVPRP